MQFSVIIVSYCSAPWIAACLGSIRKQVGAEAELIVVDNASPDETVRVVRNLGAESRLIENRQNLGFGRACNQGFEASRGRLLFMLNPDARLEQPDGLARLKSAMEEHPRWGLAGTRITSPDGCSESSPATCYPQERYARCDFSGLPGNIAWVMGASMVIRREAFAKVNGFDPGFFLSSEETDLCLRARQQGWEIGYVPEVTVWHIGMASERGRDPGETWLHRMTGLLRFWSKHYPPEDVRRLARKDWLRASLRRNWYYVAGRFRGPASDAWLKHRKYAGISEAARRLLSARPSKSATSRKRPANDPQRGRRQNYGAEMVPKDRSRAL
ncbi:MAG TPA: glycosyltransferase family 2 protein [Candidatus Acidoferrum sp.]|jgi:N-acetylglucosaminyl-diphospho-decaprenol L-rhamnosyltransferase|nr:glycosyltransferase family 2 protein [Candidatus Acidoferrum sp.]